MRTSRLPATLASVLLVLAACGSDEDSGSEDAAEHTGESSEEEGDDDNGNAAASGDEEVDFPTSSIELVVGWAAGGGTDRVGRAIASAAQEVCGWDVFVSNMEGGNEMIANAYVRDAEPDGHVIGLSTVNLAQVAHTGATDITPQDLAGVVQINDDPAMIGVAADQPYESIDELLSTAEEQTITLAVSPVGSIWHVSAVGMVNAYDGEPDLSYVPFDGTADQVAALLRGDAEGIISSVPELLPQIESGEIKPLAVMSDEASNLLPEVPTLMDSGIDWTAGAWRGVTVAPDVEDPVLAELEECFTNAYESDHYQDFIETQGFGPRYRAAEEFDTFMQDDFESWKPVFEMLGLKDG